MHGMGMLGRQTERAREAIGRLHHEQAVGICAGPRQLSPTNAPACSDRLQHPSASGGAAAIAITCGLCRSSSGAKRRKSAGAKLMLAPASRSARSIGP